MWFFVARSTHRHSFTAHLRTHSVAHKSPAYSARPPRIPFNRQWPCLAVLGVTPKTRHISGRKACEILRNPKLKDTRRQRTLHMKRTPNELRHGSRTSGSSELCHCCRLSVGCKSVCNSLQRPAYPPSHPFRSRAVGSNPTRPRRGA